MNTELDDLELSTRTGNALKSHGVYTLEAIQALTWEVFKTWSGVGRKSWWEIREVLECLKQRDDRWIKDQTTEAFIGWCVSHRDKLELVRSNQAIVVVKFSGELFVAEPE